MSLRKQAKILGITPAYLSMLVNGKRRWQPDLYERYCELVNTVNKFEGVNDCNKAQFGSAPAWGAGGRRFNSCLPDQNPYLSHRKALHR